MRVLNESFLETLKFMKKEALNIDHLLRFACHARRSSHEGGLADLQCQEAHDPAERPGQGKQQWQWPVTGRSQVQDDETQ